MGNEFKCVKKILTYTYEELNDCKKKIELSLKHAPEGALVLSRSHGSAQYFHKTSANQKKGRYIEKKDQKLISALAQKDYNQRVLRNIDQQMSQIKSMLKNIPSTELDSIYSKLATPRKVIVSPYFISDEEYAEQWMAVKYEGKETSEEMPCHITERGEMVRSKTEKILADKLFLMGIPYRYEYPVYLKGFGTVYPDFTLLNKVTRKEIYLEHFGMMDNPQYCQKAIQKIHTYGKNGIYPGKNLITTFETVQTPLDMRWVEKMITELLGKYTITV